MKIDLGRRPISTRLAISFAVTAVALELAAAGMYSAATGLSLALSVEPSKLLASGPTGASLIRWGSVVDMFHYVIIVSLVAYLRARYAGARFIDLFAPPAWWSRSSARSARRRWRRPPRL